MCNATHVPWKQRLNAHFEWAFKVTKAVMNNLRNSAIMYGLPPLPQDVLNQTAMILTNARNKAMCTRLQSKIGNEKLKEIQFQKIKGTQNMKSSSLKAQWLHQNDHMRAPWYDRCHIPELMYMPILKSYREWPVSARYFGVIKDWQLMCQNS